MKFSNLSC